MRCIYEFRSVLFSVDILLDRLLVVYDTQYIVLWVISEL